MDVEDQGRPLYALVRSQVLAFRRQIYPNDKMVYHSIEGFDPLVRRLSLRYCIIDAASDVNTCCNGKPPDHRAWYNEMIVPIVFNACYD